jgi:hypothetical protein
MLLWAQAMSASPLFRNPREAPSMSPTARNPPFGVPVEAALQSARQPSVDADNSEEGI